MSRIVKTLALLVAVPLVLAACGPAPTEPPAEPTEAEMAPTEEEMEPEEVGEVVFFSTQFNIVEEAEKFRSILAQEGFDFTGIEEGPLTDLILAGAQAGQSGDALAEDDVDEARAIQAPLRGPAPPIPDPQVALRIAHDVCAADRRGISGGDPLDDAKVVLVHPPGFSLGQLDLVPLVPLADNRQRRLRSHEGHGGEVRLRSAAESQSLGR